MTFKKCKLYIFCENGPRFFLHSRDKKILVKIRKADESLQEGFVMQEKIQELMISVM